MASRPAWKLPSPTKSFNFTAPTNTFLTPTRNLAISSTHLDAANLLTRFLVWIRLRHATHARLPDSAGYSAWTDDRVHAQENDLHHAGFQYWRSLSHVRALCRLHFLAQVSFELGEVP